VADDSFIASFCNLQLKTRNGPRSTSPSENDIKVRAAFENLL
jgi:hypothetical protein